MASVFSFDPDRLTAERVLGDDPFLIREFESQDANIASFYQRAGLYDTMQDALKAARRCYFIGLLAKASRPFRASGDWVIAYNPVTMRIQPESLPKAVSPYCFGTEEEAARFLASIGEENYARYVLGLDDVSLLVRVDL